MEDQVSILEIDTADTDPARQLRQAVFQALGAASMCWESPGAAGVFKSELATVIGDELVAFIEGQRPTPAPSPSGWVLEHTGAANRNHPRVVATRAGHEALLFQAGDDNRWTFAVDDVYGTGNYATATEALDAADVQWGITAGEVATVERVARAMAEAAVDDCFVDESDVDDDGRSGDRDWFRKLARAALAAKDGPVS
jgi:hypothetical protein